VACPEGNLKTRQNVSRLASFVCRSSIFLKTFFPAWRVQKALNKGSVVLALAGKFVFLKEEQNNVFTFQESRRVLSRFFFCYFRLELAFQPVIGRKKIPNEENKRGERKRTLEQKTNLSCFVNRTVSAYSLSHFFFLCKTCCEA